MNLFSNMEREFYDQQLQLIGSVDEIFKFCVK